jgi:hypothetical protein
MKCGNCTMCCLLLQIKETDSRPGIYCQHCEPEVGCKIYESRPEPCKIFECSWKQMENAHIDLRPDNCKALFEKWTDNVMVGTTIEKNISNLVLNQIDSFRSEGISVLMINHREKIRTYFLAPKHDRDFIKREINDSTKLY